MKWRKREWENVRCRNRKVWTEGKEGNNEDNAAQRMIQKSLRLNPIHSPHSSSGQILISPAPIHPGISKRRVSSYPSYSVSLPQHPPSSSSLFGVPSGGCAPSQQPSYGRFSTPSYPQRGRYHLSSYSPTNQYATSYSSQGEQYYTNRPPSSIDRSSYSNTNHTEKAPCPPTSSYPHSVSYPTSLDAKRNILPSEFNHQRYISDSYHYNYKNPIRHHMIEEESGVPGQKRRKLSTQEENTSFSMQEYDPLLMKIQKTQFQLQKQKQKQKEV